MINYSMEMERKYIIKSMVSFIRLKGNQINPMKWYFTFMEKGEHWFHTKEQMAFLEFLKVLDSKTYLRQQME